MTIIKHYQYRLHKDRLKHVDHEFARNAAVERLCESLQHQKELFTITEQPAEHPDFILITAQIELVNPLTIEHSDESIHGNQPQED